MKFSEVCRTCLRRGVLQPIFTDKDAHLSTNLIYMVTGIQISYNDQLPQNMCSDCIKKLNESLKFRKQCKDTETKLINIYAKANFIYTSKDNEGYIEVNIVKHELKSDICGVDIDTNKQYNDYNGKIEKPLAINKHLDTNSQSDNSIEAVEIKITNINTNLEQCDLSNIDICETELETEQLNNDNKRAIAPKSKALETSIKTKCNDIDQRQGTAKSKAKLSMESLENEDNDDNFISESLDSYIDSKPIKYLSSSEIPYELLKDPDTGKVSRVFCKLCNKEYSIKSIDAHMVKRHPGADKRKVKCDLCDNYIMMEKLNRHRIMMHGNGPFMCRYCKSTYDNKEELVSHVTNCTAKKRKRKTNESGRELQECDICHKMMQKASLRMHKAMKHAGLKPACEHCGRTFGNKFRLKEHLRAKHGYEKFQCSYCDFQSAGTMAMRNHERRHRGEKPFNCETCGAKFHAAYLLTQHRHSHRTEKLVKCDLCQASFKANNSLHMHKLTCHSSSMYKCTVCCRYYKCRHYAMKHIRHVHRYSGNTPPLAIVNGAELVKMTDRQTD